MTIVTTVVLSRPIAAHKASKKCVLAPVRACMCACVRARVHSQTTPVAVPLVDQQGGVIKRQTNLSVGTYIGAMGVDLWSMRRWQGELASHHVLVMTAQIFLDMLLHGFVQLSRVNLLVMDECHHATGAHPYREIMRCQDVCALADRPLVLGLTASILNATCHSPAQLEQLIISLETTLRSAAQTTADMMSTDMYATRPQEVMMHYSSDPDCALIEVLAGPLNDAANFISAAEAGSRSGSQRDRWTIPRTIVSDCTYILYTLGPWCAGRLAKNLSWQLSKVGSTLCPEKLQSDITPCTDT